MPPIQPPEWVHRDQRWDGVEVVTSVSMEDFFKMQALSDQLAAATLAGDAQAKATAVGIIQKALNERPELRGYSVMMSFLLKSSLERAMAARGAQMPQAQAQPQQQVGSAPQPQASGGSWGIGAAPVGAGGGGGGGGGAPQQVQGVRTYSRHVSGGASRAAPSMAAPRPSGRGQMAGAQNVRRQAGGFKTYSRPVPSRSPHVAAQQAAGGDNNPWAAQQAQTAAILASRGIGPRAASPQASGDASAIVTTSAPSGDSGGEE